LITTEISGRDLQFLTQAMENGLVQLYLGELAREKAEAEQVKKVAELLSATQEEENKRLARLASLKGINLAAAQSSAKKAVDERLGKLSGRNSTKPCSMNSSLPISALSLPTKLPPAHRIRRSALCGARACRWQKRNCSSRTR
jgi:hypothetical protein